MYVINSFFVVFFFFFILGKQRKVSEYYKKQERLLEGFNEMETMAEKGCWPGSLTEVAHSVLIYVITYYDLIVNLTETNSQLKNFSICANFKFASG